MGTSFDNLTGLRFGSLTAIERAGRTGRHAKWKLACDCGATTEALATNLKRGITKSCGCAKRTHGHIHHNRKSATYSSWASMMARCYNPKTPGFELYGGRGISVCERWHNFQNFVADIGPRPDRSYSLDRWPDHNGNYQPDNCRWATATEQASNLRRNRLLVYKGETYTITALARTTGMNLSTLRQRLDKFGMSVEEAVERPLTPRGTVKHRSAKTAVPPAPRP